LFVIKQEGIIAVEGHPAPPAPPTPRCLGNGIAKIEWVVGWTWRLLLEEKDNPSQLGKSRRTFR